MINELLFYLFIFVDTENLTYKSFVRSLSHCVFGWTLMSTGKSTWWWWCHCCYWRRSQSFLNSCQYVLALSWNSRLLLWCFLLFMQTDAITDILRFLSQWLYSCACWFQGYSLFWILKQTWSQYIHKFGRILWAQWR